MSIFQNKKTEAWKSWVLHPRSQSGGSEVWTQVMFPYSWFLATCCCIVSKMSEQLVLFTLLLIDCRHVTLDQLLQSSLSLSLDKKLKRRALSGRDDLPPRGRSRRWCDPFRVEWSPKWWVLDSLFRGASKTVFHDISIPDACSPTYLLCDLRPTTDFWVPTMGKIGKETEIMVSFLQGCCVTQISSALTGLWR